MTEAEFEEHFGMLVPRSRYSEEEYMEHRAALDMLIDRYGAKLFNRAFHSHVLAMRHTLDRYFEADAKFRADPKNSFAQSNRIYHSERKERLFSLKGTIVSVEERAIAIIKRDTLKAAQPLGGLFKEAAP